MSPRHNTRRNLREQIAREAARIMIEGGIKDFQLAKRKAADRLHVRSETNLPRNEEIELARAQYQRLFRVHQPIHLRELRRSALWAMQFLSQFSPCLVGPVLSGTADVHSEITLHLFCEPAEAVGLFLMENGIPFDLADRRLRTGNEEFSQFPCYRFVADELAFELLVFDIDARRQSPLSPVNGKPMTRAGLDKVKILATSD